MFQTINQYNSQMIFPQKSPFFMGYTNTNTISNVYTYTNHSLQDGAPQL